MKLFTAIRIPAEDAKEICSFASSVLNSQIENCRDLHITLQYLGEQSSVNEILTNLSDVAFKPFNLSYANLNCFINRPADSNVIWQEVADPQNYLLQLHNNIAQTLQDIDYKKTDKYIPHITLSYTEDEINTQVINSLNSPLNGKNLSVNCFELCEVLDDDQVPHFRTIARFRLDESRKRSAIHLVWINDFHGAIHEEENTPGAARLITAVREYIRANPDTEVLFGGDNFFGDPVCELFDGRPVVDMMKFLNVKASVIGNHDFDLDRASLQKCGDEGNFVFLAANVNSPEQTFIRKSLTLNIGGFTVGLIGFSSKEPLPGPDHPLDWEGCEIQDGIRYAGEYLRNCKCDLKIAVTHYGLREGANDQIRGEEAMSLISIPNGFDAVLTAHYHQLFRFSKGSTAVLQAGCKGRYFGVLRFTFNEDRKLLSTVPLLFEVGKDIQPDPVMQQKTDAYFREGMKTLGQKIGSASENIPHRMSGFRIPFTGTALTQIVTRSMRESTGCQIAIAYSGRFGFDGFRSGPIRLYDYKQQFPFRNFLVTMKLTGQQIRSILEAGFRFPEEGLPSPLAVGGLNLSLDPSRPAGCRIISIVDDQGNILRNNELYDVVTENYLATDPFGIPFSDGTAIRQLDQNIYDLVLEHIRKNSPITNSLPAKISIERKNIHAGSIG